MMNTDLPIDMLDEPSSTALVPVAQRAALALNASYAEKHLLALAAKHAGITLVVDKAGREQAHGAAMELTRARTTVEKAAKEARDDATKFSRAVIAEAARLVAIVEPEENRLKAVRDAWDAEQARIKREAEEKERARVLAITERIGDIKAFGILAMQCRTAERLQSLIDKLAADEMAGFDEFEAEAVQVRTATLQAMGEQHRALTEREAEAARLKAEREELARQQAAQKAEADRLAAERVELERQQAELRALRDAQLVAAVINSSGAVADRWAPADAVVDAHLVDTATNSAVQPAPVELTLVPPSLMAAIDSRDNGDRLTLGDINRLLAPVSISVAGLQQLGFEPVAQVKASRLYRACDLPAMAQAIARHVVAAAAQQLQAA